MNQNENQKKPQGRRRWRSLPSFTPVPVIIFVSFVLVLAVGTIRDRDFWLTADQRGERLFAKGKFADAAKVYTDPERIAAAQYRNGDFEAAAKTFARVPGATGAFDQGNALLMHGQYDAAIASYDRALSFRSDWKDAEENKTLAIARKQLMTAASETAEQEQTGKNKPDEIAFDQTGEDKKAPPVEMNGETPSEEELRATWLRRVQTTPGDFLRAKFAYQAQAAQEKNVKEDVK